jgi:hypothetical protein
MARAARAVRCGAILAECCSALRQRGRNTKASRFREAFVADLRKGSFGIDLRKGLACGEHSRTVTRHAVTAVTRLCARVLHQFWCKTNASGGSKRRGSSGGGGA